MQTLPTDYSHEQLVDAICAEYDLLCHDDFNPDEDMSSDEMRRYLQGLTHQQLIDETGCDDVCFTIQEFMAAFS